MTTATTQVRSFFSVRHDLVLVDEPLPYDLYVNSSSIKDREKFVRIHSQGRPVSREELEAFHRKYYQLYVPEGQRFDYLRSLTRAEGDDVVKSEALKSSALEYLGRVFDKNHEFSTTMLSENIEGCRQVVEGMVDVLGDYSIDRLRGLIGQLSFHDFYTYDHSINVSMYSITLWRAAHPRASRQELVNMGLGGLLHDLGKVKIPTHILNNPGGLTEEEYQTIKRHPGYGLELLLSGEVQVHPEVDVEVIARIVHEHHENWDGTGYPAKLKGEDIHPMARCCTIADFFDAITTKRSYNQVLKVTEGLDVMRKFRGVKLEPRLFDVFEENVDHVRRIGGPDLRLGERFDPTIPWKELPLERVVPEEDFGKIKIVDHGLKKQQS